MSGPNSSRNIAWRLLVLGHSGGVYLDIDAHIVWRLGFMIEPDYRELYLEHKAGRLTNYFTASAPGNPHLDLVIASILSNIANVTTEDVAELTWPPVLNRSIKALDVPTAYYKYTSYQGSFTNEFFQYVDHPTGKWFRSQNGIALVKR
jgi:mannosyltransferase OCH1-like enzyme